MRKWFFLSFILGSITIVHAQEVNFLIKEGEQLESERKDAEALRKYIEAIQLSPKNVKALIRGSELSGVIGNRQAEKQSKLDYFLAAKTYAERALAEKPEDADANYVMAVSLSRMAMVVGGKDRIHYTKDIRTYADAAIRADSVHFKSLHLIGKWTIEIAGLNGTEKAALRLMVGKLPEASVPLAIEYFEKVKRLKPGFILNNLDLAKAYQTLGRSDKAVEILSRLVKLPPKTMDDEGYKAEGQKILQSLL